MMKTKTLLFTLLTLVTTQIATAQQPKSTKETYVQRLETYFEEGRHYYVEIGSKVQLLRVIDSCHAIIQKGLDEGTFSADDLGKSLIRLRYNKLVGDYFYLNADTDKEAFAQAEEAFKNALNEADDPANDDQPDIFFYRFVLHEELAQLYYKQQNYDNALAELKASEKYSSHLSGDALLDFISQQAMCEARTKQFSDAINDINMVLNSYSDKKSDGYSEALRKKAKILMLQQENGGTGMVNPADEALPCYKEYFSLKKADATQRLNELTGEDREQYWMRIRPFVVDCYRTENADPAFLYDVTLFGKALLLEYAAKGKPEFVTWKQIQKKLKSNECAVEFVQYEKENKKLIGALVLHKKGEPTFVRVAEVNELLNQPLKDGGNVYSSITFDSFKSKNKLYNDSTLYTKIWTPELLNAIGKDTRRLYFAPDGPFHILAIEYMIPNEPELTSLKAENVYRLTSTRQLLANDVKTRGQKILACGGINYSMEPAESTDDQNTSFTNDEQTFWLLKDLTSGLSPFQEAFTYLRGAKMEVDSIKTLFDKRATILTEAEAPEVTVANMMTEYPIVHLSTHGFFGGQVPLANDLIPTSYDISLSQNLLALSGVNVSLRSTEFDGSQHDGMFSSREIMQMDYSNIELIVLSACQTALGYVTDDGVYGLQRGLKSAGVKGMILSLWSVSDEATTVLFQSFYNHLRTEDAHTAFMHARQELIDTGRKQERSFDPVKMKGTQNLGNYNEPGFYNAFILIDVK